MQKGVVVAKFGTILSLDWKGTRKLIKTCIYGCFPGYYLKWTSPRYKSCVFAWESLSDKNSDKVWKYDNDKRIQYNSTSKWRM